jgi:hypothetical protein
MMKYIWTRQNDDPDYDNCHAHGINGLFAPLGADSLTSPAYLKLFRAKGFPVVGLYVGHGWWAPIGAQALADKVVAEYKKATVGVPRVKLQMNLEQHDPGYIAACLERIREQLPKVGLSWSPEGFQGGWMSASFVKRIIAAKVRVVPQAFTGDMTPRAQDMVLRNLTARGYPEALVTIMYDAKNLPRDWNGYAFTEGRLPKVTP